MEWIRPLISLIAMTGVTIGFITDKISLEAFMGIAAFVVTYWFKSRDIAKERNNR